LMDSQSPSRRKEEERAELRALKAGRERGLFRADPVPSWAWARREERYYQGMKDDSDPAGARPLPGGHSGSGRRGHRGRRSPASTSGGTPTASSTHSAVTAQPSTADAPASHTVEGGVNARVNVGQSRYGRADCLAQQEVPAPKDGSSTVARSHFRRRTGKTRSLGKAQVRRVHRNTSSNH